MSIISDRIRARLEELGKNPSSVAKEAELGRSAVRDILSGKAKNPQFSTLLRLSVPLECSISYLTGELDEPYGPDDPSKWVNLDRSTWDIAGYLEAGVFRKLASDSDLATPDSNPEPYEIPKKRKLASDRRFPGKDLAIYQMRDNSMDVEHILRRDILTTVMDRKPSRVNLKTGMIVVVRFSPSDIKAHELSARKVSFSDGKLHLTCHSTSGVYRSITVSEKAQKEGRLNVYTAEQLGEVSIEGPVIHVARDLIM